MASDDHVANALKDFAKELLRNSRADSDVSDNLSREEANFRRQRLKDLATESETLAQNPRAATYQAFDRILAEAQGLGAQLEIDIKIRVASAFLQRPHIGPTTRQC